MKDTMQYVINLIVFVPITIALIIITIKLSNINIGRFSENKYVKVLEKSNLNKDTDIFILKIGDEGCVLVSSPSNTYKVKELTKEEIKAIEIKNEEIKESYKNVKIKLKDFKFKEIIDGRFSSNNDK